MSKSLIAALALTILAPAAQAEDAASLPFFGAAPWGDWSRAAAPRKWDGSYFSMNAGYSFTSLRRGASVSGPTLGVEGGKYWREGDWVHGVALQADYMHDQVARFSGRSAFPLLTQDFGGHARIKSGYLVRPDLLVYGSVGVSAVNYQWRDPHGRGKDSEFLIRPEMRAGAVWAVNDNLSVTVEVGVGQTLR